MKLIDLRKELKNEFKSQNIDIEDVDFIISEILSVSRTELVLVNEITTEQENEIREKSRQRLNSVPVDKIFNKSYFYGYEFKIDKNVLSPRPESEILVDTAIKYIKENNYKKVLDLCTGSGCIAISIKKNVDADLTASDISAKALKIAKENALLNQVSVNFIRSDMFENVEEKFDLIVSNPPYIDTDEIELLDKEVKENDPYIALDGGEMGLKYYNIIHNHLRKHLNDGGMAIFEIGEDQKEMVRALYTDFEMLDCVKDYAGLDRVIIFKKI